MDKKEKPTKNKDSRSIKSRLPDNQRIFINIVNLLIAITLVTDLLYFGKLIEISDVMFFIEINVLIAMFSFISYRIKKRYKLKLLKELTLKSSENQKLGGVDKDSDIQTRS